MTAKDKRLIFASSLGTMFEWYDFYLYVSLVGVMAPHFFGGRGQTTAEVFVLVSFVVGFLVRPLGALFFGRLGDLVGRKYTFLLTILIMGFSTFAVGLLPGHSTIGTAAPVLLIAARLLQGLAIGGEYGGAATFVAEHAPHGRRGLFTSFIQSTATLGLLCALITTLLCKWLLGEAGFASFGWRVPFFLSFVLLGVSLWIRLQLDESPVFVRMRDDGTASRAPLKDAFGNWRNLRLALIALFGLTMGQGVVWYTGQFYALSFLQDALGVDNFSASAMMAWAMALGAGFFVLFGWLSDRIGRKPIIMLGLLVAAATYAPIFERLTAVANPPLAAALRDVAIKVVADPADCRNLFNPFDTHAAASSSCDIARDALAAQLVNYSRVDAPAGALARVVVASQDIAAFDASRSADAKAERAAFDARILAALESAGYPRADDPAIVRMSGPFDVWRGQVAATIGLLFVLVFYVTMVYGPIAAALVELFPTRVRYTSVSLPYHIGNGWFGGLLPATASAMVAQTGNVQAGLWYSIAVALACLLIGVILVPETKHRDIYSGE